MVIDTLQKVRVADQGKGVYATDYQDMAALKSLADQHNIALLLVHHLRKQGPPIPSSRFPAPTVSWVQPTPSGCCNASE